MRDRNPNLPSLLAVACATALGVSAGLPLIQRKNGIGLALVMWVSVTAINAIALTIKRNRNADQIEIRSNQLDRKRHLLAYGFASLFIGPMITVAGGLVVNIFNPMNPLDFVPNLIALTILGAFAGLTVGIVLAVATIVWKN